jgi:hypothetical protein
MQGDSLDRVEELRAQIEELKNRWPAHSVPPALIMQLEELEAELEEALKTRQQGSPDAESNLSR